MIKCPECEKQFTSERSYSGHKSIHKKEGRYSTSRIKVPRKECLSCGEPTIKAHQEYCNNTCQQEKQRKDKWLLIETNSHYFARQSIRKLYVWKYGNTCQECGISEWNGHPITLELDHIDGNAINNSMENLRIICPNCHSITDTWKGKNRGHGRKSIGISLS